MPRTGPAQGGKRRVLILHNEYQQAGGEDVVAEAEAALLAAAGHTVYLERISNSEFVSAASKARALVRSHYDPGRAEWVRALVAERRAEIVHVHNFFPRLTPAVHIGAAAAGAAVVQTLHNYRLLCAAATFMRDGQVCELCLDQSRLWGLAHRCYRGSLAGSAAVTMMQQRTVKNRRWLDSVHRFIALTGFAKQKFVAGGLPPERVVVKPNFHDAIDRGSSGSVRRGALFVGRLSREKGAHLAVEAYRSLPDATLTVLGDGPEREALQSNAPPNVIFKGSVDRAGVETHMRSSEFLVVPSLWYEGFPMTIAEGFSYGLPVVASRLGSLAEIVVDNVNGRLVDAGNAEQLACVTRRLHGDPALSARLGEGARQSFTEGYSPGANLVQLERIYENAIELTGAYRPRLPRHAGDAMGDGDNVANTQDSVA